MKNKTVKRIAVVAMVAMMGMSMTACGSKADEAAATTEGTEAAAEGTESDAAADTEAADTEETAAAGTLTEEEYEAKAQELANGLVTTMTEAQEKLGSLQEGDIDAAREFIDGLKAPFVEFAAVQAPEKYADAQAKFKSGCEAMVEYLDLCVDMMDEEKAADMDAETVTAKMTELLTKIQNDLTEASTMMSGLTGEAAAE